MTEPITRRSEYDVLVSVAQLLEEQLRELRHIHALLIQIAELAERLPEPETRPRPRAGDLWPI